MAETDDKLKFVGHADSMYQTGEYVEKNPTYHVEDSAWKAEQILKMLAKNNLQPRTVCEVGCGAGEILRQLQSRFPASTEFFGYEISPQAFALCQERANQRLQFRCEDLITADTPYFDLLLCIDVFEHVPDYLSFLKSVRPKAHHKIFHIPLDMSAQWVLRGRPILREREQAGHLHYFMKDTALATLRDAGYKVLDTAYTAGAIDHPRSIKARLASWPRRLLAQVNQDLVVRVMGGYSLLVLAE
jgi:cyclopropane fatty-acyl-phospholipid synthase-like methyltransferase